MSGPIYLGPDDPLEWLRGFIGEATAAALRYDLRELAGRVRDLEPSAVKELRPDDADPDCPAAFRASNDRDGIDLHDLGRHSAAARWAIREAVVRCWWRRRDMRTRKARRDWDEQVRRATRSLLGLLRTATPLDRMALQRRGLSRRMLPARPSSDGEGWLVKALEALDRAVTEDLQRLGELKDADADEARKRKSADWRPGREAGAAPRPMPTVAHDALPVWLHFRPDARPTTNDGKSESRRSTGSFVAFVAFVDLLQQMVNSDGKGRYVRREVRQALNDHAERIAQRYGPRPRKQARRA
jgi:hypothetical protein